ncbi:aromatic ring-hydroxylating oxygenase subunit alpha [Sphingomonas sp. SRS2]|uniref:aromatic ring-hydroxylating oxygenase subunit alpha n=1 Tax=Sphingomonas sp. SRS2 TaxID=133190 RepID=UPI0006184824|nr:aromatic ring-hydroxylating dioxygenase subunit alpha [Sphingomonas sp. SRS2]KKC25231.1 hypothetical protein WP12_15300 [Sphingomonas sp. SRS2]
MLQNRSSSSVRPDFIPAEHYTSPEFARAEKDILWPRVWQIACREEQIPAVGDQFVYEICDESILIIRSAPDTISAFYNACPHRGRQLAAGPRHSKQLVCPFHGWRFTLTGQCTHVPYRENWGDGLCDEEIGLSPVKCDSWSGFVFINMDQHAEPLLEFLGEAVERLGPYDFAGQRFRWTASVETDVNWKLALEAFIEAYHVQTTHQQLLAFFDERTEAHAAGLHGFLRRSAQASGLGSPSQLLKAPPPADPRPLLLDYMKEMVFDVRSIFSDRDLAASARILSELPDGVSAPDAVKAMMKFRKEAAMAAGVGWPEITPEQIADNGSVWHIFPNISVLPQPTASLWYRFRPAGKGDNPERSIIDFWALERYAPGFAPKVEHPHYTDWRDFKDIPPFLAQDFDNLPYLQKGVRSQGFRGARTNPVQEGIISNFHMKLRQLLGAA